MMGLRYAIIVLFVTAVMSLPPVIRIGAIFTENQKDSSTEMAFKYAVYRINKDKNLLPNTTLVYDIQYVPKDDSFKTSKKVCKQLSRPVQGIFGPSDPFLGAHVQSICEALDVPHLEARIDFEPIFKEFSINLYPAQDHLNRAFKDLMSFLNWTKIAIVYEEDYGLFKLQDLVKSPPSSKIEMYIRQAGPGSYRHVLREIRHKEIYKLVVDTDPANMQQFFRAVLQLQMNDHRYHYMFTTFDIETFDLEDFKYNNVNMSAFRLVDLAEPRVAEILRHMERFQPIGQAILNKENVIEAEPALIYDSVQVFAHGLSALDRSHVLRPANLSCEKEEPWNDGLSLYNYINSAALHGLTGHIEFSEGRRKNFKLDLLKLKKEELVKVGEWKPESGVEVTDMEAFYGTTPANITLIVMTREEKPYVMVKEDKNLTGNARFEGFCIDLLEWIAAKARFEYTIILVPDHMYGVYDAETGEWNGIVKELMGKRADLAVASMTINYARERVIDFTKPFMNLGIGILFKVPSSQPTRLFSFMNPLAVEIWLYVLAAFVLVSFTLFVMARFSPYEWSKPHQCLAESEVIRNQFSVSNSFWFITGTFLRQASGVNPKATSTRVMGGIWWFFTLIIISSYTANLAAFLTVERMITPIENAADLVEQTEIGYGTLEGGSTMTFFRDSKIDIYQKMWKFMDSRKSTGFVSTYEEGVKRVLKGNYAFLMESTMLDYAVQRDCNLTKIGGLLDSKGYGIATPKGSPWRDKISLIILELQERGVIQILYDRWWKNTGDVCARDENGKGSKANALGVENIGNRRRSSTRSRSRSASHKRDYDDFESPLSHRRQDRVGYRSDEEIHDDFANRRDKNRRSMRSRSRRRERNNSDMGHASRFDGNRYSRTELSPDRARNSRSESPRGNFDSQVQALSISSSLDSLDEREVKSGVETNVAEPNTPIAVNAKPNSVEVSAEAQETELEADVLEMFGERLRPERALAPAVHSHLATLWLEIIEKGLPAEERKGFLKKNSPPQNCLFIDPPKLNLEVKAALDSSLVRRDERIIEKQEKVAASLAGVGMVIDLLIKSNPADKKQYLEPLNGVAKLLADLQHDELLVSIRKSLILKNIKAPFRDTLKDLLSGDWLFGEELSGKIKAAKVLQESSKDLKQPAKRLSNQGNNSKNLRGPPQRNQYQSNTHSRGGRVQTNFQQLQSQQPGQQVRVTGEELSPERPSASEEKQLNVGKFAGRLAFFKQSWLEVTSDETILSWITGYRIPFTSKVVQHTPPAEPRWSNQERFSMREQIVTLLGKGAIQECQSESGQFVSKIFLVPKPDGSHRFILNLKQLNEFIATDHFKLEDGKTAKQMITRGCFMTTIDSKDAYYLISIAKYDRKFLRLIFEGKFHQFTLCPSG